MKSLLWAQIWSFYLMHLNARSLIGNFDKFKILLANMKKTFSIILVSETWLNDLTLDFANMSGTVLSPITEKLTPAEEIWKTIWIINCFRREIFQIPI